MEVKIPEELVIKAIQQEYFAKKDAFNVVGVSRTTFDKWLREHPNELRPSIIDGQVLYAKKDLLKFMENHKRK